MVDVVKGNFAADGSSETVTASKFTILAGSNSASDFGGGTINIEVSHDGVLFTTADTITEEGVKTSVDYVGGVNLKLTLSGATTPDCDYSFKYE